MNLNIKYSAEKDAKTYLNFIRNFKSFKHGRANIQGKLMKGIDESLQTLLLSEEPDDVVFEKVVEYLEQSYKNDPKPIEDSISKLASSWATVGENIIFSLEFLYGKPFPFDDVTMYLTTSNIYPYNYKQRYFYATYKFLSAQHNIAIHELNHFMFYFYYPERDIKLSTENYELLKESLTIFTNPSKEGKPNEKPLRDLFKSKIWKSLDEAIQAGIEFLLNKQTQE